jgi:high-affinity iron transporter
MTQQAKSLKGEIEGAVTQAIGISTPDSTPDSTSDSTLAARGVFSLIFLAVLREGFETVIFLAAQFQSGWIPTVGAIVGLLSATAIGVGFFKLGLRINLKQFFQVMGIFLLLIVGGLVIGTLSHGDRTLLAARALSPAIAQFCGSRETCILGPSLWNLHEILSDRAFPGILLKTLFGYRDKIYEVQAIVWISFIVGIGSLYQRSLNPITPSPHSQKKEAPTP